MFDENANKNPEKVILYFEEELWTNKQVGPHCEVKDLNLVYFAIWQSIVPCYTWYPYFKYSR